MHKHIVVLTGAGMSQESGISTFRDANGLWENHDIMDVASIDGWRRNPALVLDFYNQRRRQLHDVAPNQAHLSLASLELNYRVTIITQNVDNLHEAAGSANVIHLHGELFKACSERDKTLVSEWTQDIALGSKAADGEQLRPFIVWFGEDVPELENAMREVRTADILIVIGTSLQVYPAAGLIHYAPSPAKKFIIDPHCDEYDVPLSFIKIKEKAVDGMRILLTYLENHSPDNRVD
jgi:NAD-dependent deacetylase